MLLHRVTTACDRLVETCARLVRTPSENPPGDTRAIAHVVAELLRPLDGCEVAVVTGQEPLANVVARIRGRAPGRRLIFNGHLDTFPVGDPTPWTVDPLGGVVRDDCLYGRGVSDMKGGMAASIIAFALLAEMREAWAGEIVLTLASDEETMGHWGTEYLLETVAHASGDAMICGDAGSPMVIRFGEKGLVWLELQATGRAAHGAHVHLGESAIDRLTEALHRLAALRHLRVRTPPQIARTMVRARSVSEAISGAGEARVLKSVTVNVGVIAGGSKVNLVPDEARAEVDVRLPAGIGTRELLERIKELLSPIPGVSYTVLRQYEPNWSDPAHELFPLMVANGRAVLGRRPVLNMRVGASDARLYRVRGIPAAVYGPTPHNMGGPDEHVTLDDLVAVCYVHALAAFEFLSSAEQ